MHPHPSPTGTGDRDGARRGLRTTDVAVAVDALRAGGLVAFPTETVYGLGADARCEPAVRRVFAAKGRPADHPLIVHLAAGSWLPDWAAGDLGPAQALAEAFWPGPLTVLVRRAPSVGDTVTGGRATVGLRVPDHPVALALLAGFGGGVAAPSANRFGRVSPTTAGHVLAELGDEVDVVLDGGPCAVGVESTIVDVSGARPQVLRPGAIDAAALADVLGVPVDAAASGPSRAPGMLAAHYAPRARVLLAGDAAEAAAVAAGQAAAGLRVGLLTPAGDTPPGVGLLDVPADAAGYARLLYARLRQADRAGFEVVVAVLPAGGGLAVAVRDRLGKAAAGSASGRPAHA